MSWASVLQKHGLGWMVKDIMYRLDWRYPNPSSVAEWLQQTTIDCFEHPNDVYYCKNQPQDKRVLLIFRWAQAIKYITDKENWNTPENWERIRLVLSSMQADCENHAQVMYGFSRFNKVNLAQIRFTAGGYRTTKLNHAWFEYLSDETGEWHIFDATNKYANYKTMKDVPTVKEMADIYHPHWSVSEAALLI